MPQVVLTLEAPAPRGPWTMRVTNEGDVPVSLVADARLLTLEVRERSAARPVRCELPADMRPASDSERALVVPPKRSYAETFEPRLYCFGAASRALAQGAVVVAHLGWTGGRQGPPYAVSSVEGVEPQVEPLRELSSAPIALPDEPTPTAAEVAPATTPRLLLQGAAAVDAPRPTDVTIPVTLRNASGHPVTLRFRPETLRFEVTGPTGKVDCPWPTLPTAPMRELFTTLPPGGSSSLDLVLASYCGNRTFDTPGLFLVSPRLDTRQASGEVIGIRSFDGVVFAQRPTVVRLRTGAAAPQPLRRPALAP